MSTSSRPSTYRPHGWSRLGRTQWSRMSTGFFAVIVGLYLLVMTEQWSIGLAFLVLSEVLFAAERDRRDMFRVLDALVTADQMSEIEDSLAGRKRESA